jgi:hypothetical protein
MDKIEKIICLPVVYLIQTTNSMHAYCFISSKYTAFNKPNKVLW